VNFVNGSFVCKEFDLWSANQLVTGLHENSLVIQPKWMKGVKEGGQGDADGLLIYVNNQQLISYTRRGGHVETGMLKPDEEVMFFSVLGRLSFVHEPPSALTAYGLLAAYCVLHLCLQVLWRADQSETSWLVSLAAWGAASTVAVALVHHLFPSSNLQRWKIWCGLAILAIGFALTVPSALLLMPILNYRSRQRLYERLHVNNATPATPAQ
jgi:hypothetical protein